MNENEGSSLYDMLCGLVDTINSENDGRVSVTMDLDSAILTLVFTQSVPGSETPQPYPIDEYIADLVFIIAENLVVELRPFEEAHSISFLIKEEPTWDLKETVKKFEARYRHKERESDTSTEPVE